MKSMNDNQKLYSDDKKKGLKLGDLSPQEIPKD